MWRASLQCDKNRLRTRIRPLSNGRLPHAPMQSSLPVRDCAVPVNACDHAKTSRLVALFGWEDDFIDRVASRDSAKADAIEACRSDRACRLGLTAFRHRKGRLLTMENSLCDA